MQKTQKTAYSNVLFTREDMTFMGDLRRSMAGANRPALNGRPAGLPLRTAGGPAAGAGSFIALGAPLATRPAGRPAASRARMGDIFEDIQKELGPLTSELDALIAKIPVETAGPFKARRDECLAKSSTFSKYKCLYDLFRDVKNALEEGGAPTGTQYVPPPPPPQESQIPWLWIGMGAGALALVGVLAFATKG